MFKNIKCFFGYHSKTYNKIIYDNKFTYIDNNKYKTIEEKFYCKQCNEHIYSTITYCLVRSNDISIKISKEC